MLEMRCCNIVRGLAMIIALMVAEVSHVQASWDQSSIGSPGGFIQTGATGDGFGYGIIPGADMQNLFSDPGSDFHEQAFSGAGLASQAATFSGGPITNSATGSASLGQVKMQADNTAPNNSSFPGGRTNGGWKDTLTVVPNNPTQNGLPAHYVFTLDVSGFLSASGFAGSAGLGTAIYKDGVEPDQEPFWDPGSSDPLSTDRQRAHWGVSSSPDVNRNFSSTVTLSVPITLGTPFELGVYGFGTAGMRSQSSVGGSSSSLLSVQNTINWGGTEGVFLGDPVNDLLEAQDYTLTSASGTDWRFAIPEPGSASLLLLGAGAAVRRRRGRLSRKGATFERQHDGRDETCRA